MSPKIRLVAVCLLLVSATAAGQPHIPDDLRDWQEWVLKDKEYRNCPFYFDRPVDQPGAFICSWPGELRLAVESSGAEFSQQWTVYAIEQRIVLPGGCRIIKNTIYVYI